MPPITIGATHRLFIRDSLHRFDDAWDSIPSKERCRLVELLIRTVNFDGPAGTIDIVFRSNGIKSLGSDEAENNSSQENAQ